MILPHGQPMQRGYAVIELADDSTFDPFRDNHLDEIAEDLFMAAHRVRGVAVYPSFGELDEDAATDT